MGRWAQAEAWRCINSGGIFELHESQISAKPLIHYTYTCKPIGYTKCLRMLSNAVASCLEHSQLRLEQFLKHETGLFCTDANFLLSLSQKLTE